jgi:hypothetical protein
MKEPTIPLEQIEARAREVWGDAFTKMVLMAVWHERRLG